MKAIGVFGGAFAPFHNGHLRLAIEARERLDLSEIRLIPTAQAPHRRDSRISPQRRLEWLKLALRKEPGLIADDCEILRQEPSYSVDTLATLRERFPDAALMLLMGADAFAHLHTWHRWQSLLQLAHLVVVSRAGTPGARPSPECAEVLSRCEAGALDALHAAKAGLWLRLDLPLLDISSTRIRRLLKARRSVRGLLPDAILSHMTAADIAALTQDDDAKTH
jgi:nicotinate-nucleotide adenylyltransferase